MIHIVTVHWKDDRWIDIQLKYFKENIKNTFRVYAFLNDIPSEHEPKFYYCSTEPIIPHAVKLNVLADIVWFNAVSPDDWLIFIDGDAFPIADIVTFGEEHLRKYPLLAIQRKENSGDIQPHPSFCLTTVGFWKSIRGDWKPGHQWLNDQDRLVTDVGGNLMKILNENHMEWYPLTRSNTINWDPLFFGIYDDLIYHHGAGFRRPWERVHLSVDAGDDIKGRFRGLYARGMSLYNIFPNSRIYNRFLKWLNPRRKLVDLIVADRQNLSERVFKMVQEDFYFYKTFNAS